MEPGVSLITPSPPIHLIVAPNPSLLTGPGTNTYVVGSDPACVIDPAVPEKAYIEAVREAAGRVEVILVTHRHPDHVGGVRALASVSGATVRAFGQEPAGGVDVVPLSDGEMVVFGGVGLRALHTPGHASDHLCFLLEGVGGLFSGDNVLGEGTAVIAPPDGNMRSYLATLERLRELAVDRIYPGHFRPLDGGREVLDRYLAHRTEREAAIVAAVMDSRATIDEIVARAYTDTPPELHPIALHSARAHLEMLEEDGRVTRVDDRWSATELR
jgi:glyoxylase-like metal-dependent hydrolase (beta-lactamase superfamily II)